MGGTQHFQLQQRDFVFVFALFVFCLFLKKKRILCGNEWDNKSKQIIKISNQNISAGPHHPVNPLRPQSPHYGLDVGVLPSQPQLSPQSSALSPK